MSAEDWERFAKTSDQSDRRWIDGLLGAIRDELSSPALSAAGRAGDPFELLCAELLDAQPGVATVERVPVEYDWNTDLIGKDENGRSVWYVQCKFWDVRKKAAMNEVAAWIAKVENKITADSSGQTRIDAHAAWVTTGLIHDGATGQVVQAHARSGIQFQVWDHDVLCHMLLTTQGVGFVKTESRGGVEYVAVNRAVLREFRLAAEAGLGEAPTGIGHADDEESARPRFLSQMERRQALAEVLMAAGEPLPFEELRAKAGEWLGLSEEEQRFAEPGKPIPLFEFLLSQVLEDMRKEDVVELHSGRRWSLAVPQGQMADAQRGEQSSHMRHSGNGDEVQRPRFLSAAEATAENWDVDAARAAALKLLGPQPKRFFTLSGEIARALGLDRAEMGGDSVRRFDGFVGKVLRSLQSEGKTLEDAHRHWRAAAGPEVAVDYSEVRKGRRKAAEGIREGSGDSRDEWIEVDHGVGSNTRWMDVLIQEIHDACQGTRGEAFEWLCRAILAQETGVSKAYVTDPKTADLGLDVVCQNADGVDVIYAQCKQWPSPDTSPDRRFTTKPTMLAAFKGNVDAWHQQSRTADESVPIRAIWITLGDVVQEAHNAMDKYSLGPLFKYEIWGQGKLCTQLVGAEELDHLARVVQVSPRENVMKQVLHINRTALRAFRNVE